MRTFTELQKKLVPDLLKIMQQRYFILQAVENFEPIGRRSLADHLNMTERYVRSEVDFLHNQGLLDVTSKGMYISKEGKLVLEQLSDMMREIVGLSVLEKQIREKLNVRNVIIVPGNSDEYEWVKQEMGKACVAYLKKIVSIHSVIAVTGGTTMAAIADVMTPLSHDILFVPARGGIGEKAENQASSIVSQMAQKANGEYRQLFVPDPISESAYQTLINEPMIKDVLDHIKGSNIVIHGIGDANTMAKRRKTSEETMHKLLMKHAVSEAFGYYFNQDGSVVHKVRTVGLQLEDLSSVDHVVAVAGGTSKAEAIESYFKQGKSDLLITDEAAAEQILRGKSF
ncbi:sugar-binding transcriptional regulator [Oceanobacillus sp. Castelsardo]|uniref:sugar-binding transcriptional regulator n=1 Tax=Oceanobacillus sp. Castelsardo TaxID=1851204 RepID=UPI000838B1D3|nr:sugar-binding domain-containing protein [Oceanobacillus sp. Castelsardo]